MGTWTPGPGPTNGDDTFVGDDTHEFVSGLAGNDIMSGNGGADNLSGDDGGDRLDGGGGDDNLDGGAGNDRVDGGNGYDIVGDGLSWLLNNGDDVLLGGAGNDRISAGRGVDTIDGGTGYDVLTLTRETVSVALHMDLALQATSPIVLADGSSIVGIEQLVMYSGSGDDTIGGGDFIDEIEGRAGADTILGRGGDDLLNGGDGNDVLDGGDGADQLNSGVGDDVLYGGAGDDILELYGTGEAHGGDGDDTMYAAFDVFTRAQGMNLDLFGDAGNDVLQDSEGNDTLDGGQGDDSLSHTTGIDDLRGGAGVDTAGLFLWQDSANQTLDLRLADTGTLTLLDGTTIMDFERFTVLTGSGADNVTGGDFADIIRTGDGNDIINGGGGNDELESNAGADTVDGGDGNDFLIDWESLDSGGSDTVLGGSGDDILFVYVTTSDWLDGGDGIDTARLVFFNLASAVTYTLGDTSVQGATTLNFEKVDLSGTEWNDVLTGGALDDRMSGLGGDDTLNGGGGDDVLGGGAGTDQIDGGDGNDQITIGLGYVTGGAGADLVTVNDSAEVHSGDDADTLVVSQFANGALLFGDGGDDVMRAHIINPFDLDSAFQFNGGDGTDTFDATIYSQSGITLGIPAADVGAVTLPTGATITDVERLVITVKGPGGDTITGGDFGDVVNSGDGNDTVNGGGGDDILRLGVGFDTAHGGGGNDIIDEGSEFTFASSLHGDDGDDLIWAQAISGSILDGGAGIDTLRLNFTGVNSGGITLALGNQTAAGVAISNFEIMDVAGTSFNDTITGGALADIIGGSGGNDNLSGGSGDDRIGGGSGNDTINGGDGNDLVGGDEGVDTLIGGAGNDTYYINIGDAVDIVTEAAGQGTDEFVAWETYTLAANVENGSFGFNSNGELNGTGNSLDNTLIGSNFANILRGAGGNDVLRGGEHDDTLLGESGNDHLDGESGNDAMDGGAGDDTYVVDSPWDTIAETSANGEDSVIAWIGFTLGDHLEHLTLAGASAVEGTGNALHNVITGNTAANVLVGLAGNDTLDGGDADDLLIGGEGADTLNGGAGFDTASYSTSATSVAINLATSPATGGEAAGDTLSSIENVIGSAWNDTLIGDSAVNRLDGGAGDDTLVGGLGVDTIQGGAGNDTIAYAIGDGNGVIDGGSDFDTLNLSDGAAGSLLNASWSSVALTALSGNGLSNVENVNADMGGGTDWLIYAAASVAVAVNLSTGSASGFTSIAGVERVIGGNGNDALTGDGFDNRLDGGAGDDALAGGGGIDTLLGGDGADVLAGGLANDSLLGGIGADTFNWVVGDGRDTIDGGADTDTFNATGSAVAELGQTTWNGASVTALMDNSLTSIELINLDLGGGVDWLIYNTGFAVSVDLSANSASGFASVANIEKVIGGAGGDTLTGDGLANRLDGQGGDDVLDGGAGSDAVLGGDGADVIQASAGNDSLQGQGGNDTFHWSAADGRDTFNGGADTDTVNLTGSASAEVADTNWNGSTITGLLNNALIDIETVHLDLGDGGPGGDWLRYNTTSAVSVDLGAGTATGFASITNVENLIGGTGGDALTGDAGANKINANAGDDVITGGAGADNLIGGLGNDAFVYAAGAGADTINDFDAWDDGGQDLIDVTGFGINAGDFAARVAIIDTGADTVVRIDDDVFITLKNVSGDGDNSISIADFILA